MAPKFSPAPLVASMNDRVLGDMAAISGVADGATQVVVVSQLVRENGETADLLQHLAAQRDGGAETRMGHAKAQARQNIGQKLIIDSHCRQSRPDRACRCARVETGHKANRRISQGRNNLLEIGAPNANIAIGHHHHIAPYRTLHVDEVANLAVLTVQSIIDDEGDINSRVGALKIANHPHSLVADIMDAADDLNPSRIVLEAKALQVSVKTRLRAVKRFQDRHKGLAP